MPCVASKPKGPLFQFHLATALMAQLVAGLLMWLNMTEYFHCSTGAEQLFWIGDFYFALPLPFPPAGWGCGWPLLACQAGGEIVHWRALGFDFGFSLCILLASARAFELLTRRGERSEPEARRGRLLALLLLLMAVVVWDLNARLDPSLINGLYAIVVLLSVPDVAEWWNTRKNAQR